MAERKFYATGKRKTAIARVWLAPGSGSFKVNEKSLDDYFGGLVDSKAKVEKPFLVTDTIGQYDVMATLAGGGISAQSEALRHGIAKALLEVQGDYRHSLKKAGLLTRDSRAKERKKYGKKSARASFQFSKR